MKVRRVQTREDIQQAYPCSTGCPIPFWAEGLPLCREWFADNLGKAIEGFHLEGEDGKVIGHIYWAASDQALVSYDIEEGAAYIYCDWVQREYRGRGGMRLLFRELVDSLWSQGCQGILVDSTEIEDYMHYMHFLKRGFRVVREGRGSRLLYYPITRESVKVVPLKANLPEKAAGGRRMEVLVIGSRLCPVGAYALMAVRKVAREFGDRVAVREIPASREFISRCGVADGIYINGELKFFEPVREDQVRKAIEEGLEKYDYK